MTRTLRRRLAGELGRARALVLQNSWRQRVLRTWPGGTPQTVAGVDASVRRDRVRAAAVVHSFPGLAELEIAVALGRVTFPYVPGLLAFREGPAILDALDRLTTRPDVLLVDGHGVMHPRRFGLACLLGVCFDVPAIGCGKSRLVGRYREPAARRGACSVVRDAGEVIGSVVRTRDAVKPLFVSVGHRIDLPRAIRLVLRAAPRYRLPEPIRAAHRAAGAW